MKFEKSGRYFYTMLKQGSKTLLWSGSKRGKKGGKKGGKSLTQVNIILKMIKNPETLFIYVYLYDCIKCHACYPCIQGFASRACNETCIT